MRVVVDTNVFVSSFFGGKPKAVIDLWRIGHVALCLSGPIVEEYVDVLQRLGLEPVLVRELLSLIATGHNIAFAASPRQPKVLASDPADDKFFACAAALKADVIITGDKAVRAVQSWHGIAVRTPDEFLKAAQAT